MAPLEGALDVAGDALAVLEHLDRRARHPHPDLGPCVLTRHRVVVAIDLDVVVDANPRHLPFSVLVGQHRQRPQGRLVHLGEGAGAAAGQLLERPLVQVVEQRAQRPVQFVEAEEALVAQSCQHPARDHQHAVLDLGLILGAAGARRQHGHAVMLGQVVIGGVDVRFVARGFRHAAAQVVGYPQLGAAAEEAERAHVAAYPVRQLLAPGRLDVGVVRRAQHGHEHLGGADFAGAAVGHADGLTGVVDEQALARRVGLPHRRRQLLAPAPVVFAECAVLEAAWLLGLVLLPQQFQRHALAAQFIVHGGPSRRRPLHRRRFAGWEQQPLQGRVVALGWQGRGQACQRSAGYVVGHSGGRNVDDAGDFPLGAALLEMQSQHFMDFAHG